VAITFTRAPSLSACWSFASRSIELERNKCKLEAPGDFCTLHVEVIVAVALGLAETDAVDDGRMVERVRDDCVVGAYCKTVSAEGTAK